MSTDALQNTASKDATSSEAVTTIHALKRQLQEAQERAVRAETSLQRFGELSRILAHTAMTRATEATSSVPAQRRTTKSQDPHEEDARTEATGYETDHSCSASRNTSTLSNPEGTHDVTLSPRHNEEGDAISANASFCSKSSSGAANSVSVLLDEVSSTDNLLADLVAGEQDGGLRLQSNISTDVSRKKTTGETSHTISTQTPLDPPNTSAIAADFMMLQNSIHMLQEHVRLVSDEASQAQQAQVEGQMYKEHNERLRVETRVLLSENAKLKTSCKKFYNERRILIREVRTLRQKLASMQHQGVMEHVHQYISEALSIHEQQLLKGTSNGIAESKSAEETDETAKNTPVPTDAKPKSTESENKTIKMAKGAGPIPAHQYEPVRIELNQKKDGKTTTRPTNAPGSAAKSRNGNNTIHRMSSFGSRVKRFILEPEACGPLGEERAVTTNSAQPDNRHTQPQRQSYAPQQTQGDRRSTSPLINLESLVEDATIDTPITNIEYDQLSEIKRTASMKSNEKASTSDHDDTYADCDSGSVPGHIAFQFGDHHSLMSSSFQSDPGTPPWLAVTSTTGPATKTGEQLSTLSPSVMTTEPSPMTTSTSTSRPNVRGEGYDPRILRSLAIPTVNGEVTEL